MNWTEKDHPLHEIIHQYIKNRAKAAANRVGADVIAQREGGSVLPPSGIFLDGSRVEPVLFRTPPPLVLGLTVSISETSRVSLSISWRTMRINLC